MTYDAYNEELARVKIAEMRRDRQPQRHRRRVS